MGAGHGPVKMVQSLPTYDFPVFPFLSQYFLLGCCKPLTIFLSSDKVDSDSFAYFGGVSLEGRALGYLLHHFADVTPTSGCLKIKFDGRGEKCFSYGEGSESSHM